MYASGSGSGDDKKKGKKINDDDKEDEEMKKKPWAKKQKGKNIMSRKETVEERMQESFMRDVWFFSMGYYTSRRIQLLRSLEQGTGMDELRQQSRDLEQGTEMDRIWRHFAQLQLNMRENQLNMRENQNENENIPVEEQDPPKKQKKK